jgi:hypothetical protein
MSQITYGTTTYDIPDHLVSYLEDNLPRLLSSGQVEHIEFVDGNRTTRLYFTPGVPIALHIDLKP